MFESTIGYMEALLIGIKAKAIIAFVATLFIAIVGENYLAYEILAVLAVGDILTGFAVAWINKSVSSRKGWHGVVKLITYFILVISAHQLTRYTPVLAWLEDFLVIYIAITEMVSILENANKLGFPIPTWVTEKLESYLDKKKDEVV